MPRADPNKVRHTTERPHMFGWHAEQAGTLLERVMEQGGREILAVIAKRQSGWLDCRPKDLPGVNTGSSLAFAVRALGDMGLVDMLESPKTSASAKFRLTEAGWKAAGVTPPLGMLEVKQ